MGKRQRGERKRAFNFNLFAKWLYVSALTAASLSLSLGALTASLLIVLMLMREAFSHRQHQLDGFAAMADSEDGRKQEPVNKTIKLNWRTLDLEENLGHIESCSVSAGWKSSDSSL